jgi:hypothetical protein
MENAKNRRLQALRANGNSRVYELVKRLNELRPQLKAPVYGPILQEVGKLCICAVRVWGNALCFL